MESRLELNAQIDLLQERLDQYANLAFDMYALLCNSKSFDNNFDIIWAHRFNELKEKYHAYSFNPKFEPNPVPLPTSTLMCSVCLQPAPDRPHDHSKVSDLSQRPDIGTGDGYAPTNREHR